MKLLFFGTSVTSAKTRHGRILDALLDGVADRGHHIVFVESTPDAKVPAESTYCKILRYSDWDSFKMTLEKEAETASALIVTDGFAEGFRAVDWLLDLPVPAHLYYSLDPWDTLRGLDSEGAAPWLRADQVPLFDLVFSAAGGPALEAFTSRWGAREGGVLYEAIDTAEFYPRKPEDRFVCDLALVADRDPASQGVVEGFLLETAKALPSHRFVVAGAGWDGAGGWPENVERVGEADTEMRAHIYSSARLVLVPTLAGSVDYAMPIELLEPAACAAACAVVNRPGLTDLFTRDREILVPESAADLVPFLTDFGDGDLVALGHNAEKAVLLKYAKLPCSRRFEQRVAQKFFAAKGN